jgi:RNA polymerase sigma-70 factor (ECF subfamily)
VARIAAERDQIAFARVFASYAPRLERYFRRRGIDLELAHDLIQEVMIRVWRKAPRFNAGRGVPATWIFAIARSCLVDGARRERRFAGRRFRAWEEERAGAPPVPPDERFDLRRALSELPPDQAAVLEGCYFAGLSMREMADVMRRPLGTIKTRARLGLSRLQALLGTKTAARPEVSCGGPR